jgi:hypothetical protein
VLAVVVGLHEIAQLDQRRAQVGAQLAAARVGPGEQRAQDLTRGRGERDLVQEVGVAGDLVALGAEDPRAGVLDGDAHVAQDLLVPLEAAHQRLAAGLVVVAGDLAQDLGDGQRLVGPQQHGDEVEDPLALGHPIRRPAAVGVVVKRGICHRSSAWVEGPQSTPPADPCQAATPCRPQFVRGCRGDA